MATAAAKSSPAAVGVAAAAAAEMASETRARVRAAMRLKCGLGELEAADAEVGVFNWAVREADALRAPRSWASPRFVAVYAAKARSVLANLDRASYVGNAALADRVAAGEVKPHDVAFMTPQEAHPERWREVLELKVQRDEYAATVRPVAMTDQFRCKRCKKRECVSQELQLRSADEPATIIVTCISCSNTWRIG